MATFVVAHGAWSAGWAWKKMRPLMRAAGHELWTPTYTGLGERAHLGHADVSLDTHIQDIVAVLETEDLADVILIGHSYGGMVATGVADRARDRVAKLVYLDAFAPADGQAIFDLVPPDIAARMRAGAAASESGFGIPVNPMPSDTAPEDQAWAGPRRKPQPVQAFATKLKLSAEPAMPRYLHLCKEGRHRRQLPPVLSARTARRLEDLRGRREPQSAHHQSAGAARDPQRDRQHMTTARTIGIGGHRPARQRTGAPADRRGLRSEGLRHRCREDRGVREGGRHGGDARRGRALRCGPARGVRHGSGRGRGDERDPARRDAGGAQDRAVRLDLRSGPHRGADRPRRAADRDDRDAGVRLERAGAQRRWRRPDRRRARRRRLRSPTFSMRSIRNGSTWARRAMADAPSSRSIISSA